MTAPEEALLDTSAWLALATGDAALNDGLKSAHSVLCHLALAEILALEALGRITGETAALHEVLAGARREPIVASDARAASEIYARNRGAGGKASLVDCLLLAVARRIGAPLVTLDADLRKEKGVVVLARRARR